MKDHCETAPTATVKHSYTVPCASAFRDAIDRLAARRRVNVGDIARSVLLVMPAETIAVFADPGEPESDDRETVILKSGPSAGRPWRRKPRLQVRMAPGYEIDAIRRALGMALAMEQGALRVRLDDPSAPPPPRVEVKPEPKPAESFPSVERRRTAREQSKEMAVLSEEVDRLRAIIAVLAFDPLPEGIVTRADALHVLGFPPGTNPDRRTLRAKFRMLATIHHPDSNHGSHDRMSQLNQAMEVLRDCA